MNEGFVNYLASIDITGALRERIDSIYGFYVSLCPEEITDLLVTDYVKEDGSREYENLWFFSVSFIMEAKRFVTVDDFDMMPHRRNITYWKIQKSDYDFKKATDKSRLILEFNVGGALTGGSLKASKGNCDRLRDVLLKYIVPNMVGQNHAR